jgi:hypothetical protein
VRKPIDEAGHVLDIEKDRSRFKTARTGDYLMTMFQCDLCHFRNCYKRDPDSDNEAHQMAMKCIRRANLDAMWSRETSTVTGNYQAAKKIAEKARSVEMPRDELFPRMGPWRIEDSSGMGIAVCVLLRTLDRGINEPTIQFGTARKFRSAFSNIWGASLEGDQNAVAVRDMTKMHQTNCPTNKAWFERFEKGLHSRMGDKSNPDLAMSIEVIHELMRVFDEEWENCEDAWGSEARGDILFPALFCILTFCASLRGEETPLMDLSGVLNHYLEGRDHPTEELRHVTIPLLGRFKTETGEHYHMIPVVWETSSGLCPGMWYMRMIEWYQALGISHGPVFRNEQGKRIAASEYEYIVISKLEDIQMRHPEWIPRSVNVADAYGLRRSMRKGSETEALNQKVDPLDIHFMNRWRVVENAKGKNPMLRMISHYAEMRLLLKTMLRYSRAL